MPDEIQTEEQVVTEATPAATAAATAEPAKQAATKPLAAGVGEEIEPKQGAATWPDDWRTRFAGKDAEDLKQLARYDSPEGVWRKTKNLEKKLNERTALPPKPGKDALPEELTAYRKAVGVPEKPEAYIESLQLGLAKGKVLGDADKPVLDFFAEKLHGHHVHPEAFSAMYNVFQEYQEKVAAERAEADIAFHDESAETLKAEWGGDIRRNLNAIKLLFRNAPGGADADNPESLIARVFTSRTADGRLLGDDPEFSKLLASVALIDSTNIPPSFDEMKGMNDEISQIQKVMRDKPDDYWRDEAMQARYRQLLEDRDRIQARSSRAA